MDEITEEFLIESREAVDQLDRDLVLLEASPSATDVIARVFRALHTIKGSCGFLDFNRLGQVAHTGESLLARIRDGHTRFNTEVASAMLGTVDAIRGMLDAISTTGRDGEQDYPELIAELTRLSADVVAVADVVEAPPLATPTPIKRRARKRKDARPSTQLLSLRPAVAPSIVPVAALASPVELAVRAAEPAPAASSHQAADTVRVDVELLDRLMDLAGELVLTRNQVREIQQGLESSALTSAAQRLNLVTAGLQEGIMLMRMQPVEHLFGKFPRLVRDTAKQCGKLASVELHGKNAELDRTLLESIKDPLTHLIRNAVDHGIELPDVRAQSGKPREGLVSVRAVHQSGHVAIEISDDGAGIPLDKVRQKAVGNGLISAERAAKMSDAEATSLIFLPGLSTASSVTSVSGRGVGMDVVKTNVERLGGTVEVETVLGAGTTFRLKLPLTLAIVPALIVEACGERYAIPQVHLQELVLVDRRKQGLDSVYDAPVFRLRDELLPVVFLSEVLEQATRAECLARDKAHLAVLQVNGLRFGLAVDRVIDQQEVVVKPLAPQLERVAAYSACTILGDGRVVLIVDAAGIAQRAHVTRVRELDTRSASAHALPAASEPLTSFLLVAEAELRVALPLERVTRLETVPASSLERSGGREVLQHEGQIIPLVRLANLVPEAASSARGVSHVNVVVLAAADRRVGVVVEDVIDVVDLCLPPSTQASDGLTTASVVVHGRVTDVWDVEELLSRAGIVVPALLRSA